MSILTVTIPGMLNPRLNPNRSARNHHAKSRVRNELKEMGFLYGKQAAYGVDLTGADRATYHVVLGKAKGEKQKDADNLVASIKGGLDGIARALDVDDRGWSLGSVSQVRDPDGIGYLTIRLEWEHAKETAA